MGTEAGAGEKRIYWDDIIVGQTVPFGRKVVTKEEIIEFARTFDPQPFHLDEEAAKDSMIGRLCASGWHSCVILMRMMVDEILKYAKGLGSPGIAETKWLKPVLPGDELTARYTCTSKRELRSRPGVGVCQFLFEMLNQNGEVVMTWDVAQYFRIRGAEAA